MKWRKIRGIPSFRVMVTMSVMVLVMKAVVWKRRSKKIRMKMKRGRE